MASYLAKIANVHYSLTVGVSRWIVTKILGVMATMVCWLRDNLAVLTKHPLVTDGRADIGLYSVYRASITSRGKNVKKEQ